MILLANFFVSHFTGGLPKFAIFTFILAIIGIIFNFFFVLGFVVDAYIFLKVTKYEPAGQVCKTLSWCVLIPTLIFHGCLFLVNLLLIALGRIEWITYLYDTFRWLLYIWIVGLIVVAVWQYKPEHKTRNMIGIIGLFALNLLIWMILDWMFMQDIFKLFL